MRSTVTSKALIALTASIILTSCSSGGLYDLFGESPKPKLPGTRINALQSNPTLQVDQTLAATQVSLPAVQKSDAPEVGVNAQHLTGNLALSKTPALAWSRSIGSGTSDSRILLSVPVVANGNVYTLDTDGNVSALTLADGDRLWYVSVLPDDAGDNAFGGGLAYADNRLYVATGAGEILALKPEDGSVLWRRTFTVPFRSAPTIADGHLYAISIDSQLHVVDAATGTDQWSHTGIVDAASLLGTSSPAISGDVAIVPYSSGELFGLRTQNGHVLWSENLASLQRTSSLPGLADIQALPVIDGDQVFAISHSGRMVALSLLTGARIWDQDIGGLQTPVIAGDYLFLISNRNELVALRKADGRVRWTLPLPSTTEAGDKGDPVAWNGPALGDGLLWIVSSDGQLYAVDATTGRISSQQKDLDPAYLPPIIADGTLLILSDDAELYAYR